MKDKTEQVLGKIYFLLSSITYLIYMIHVYIGSKIYIEKIFSKKYPNNIFDWLQGENRNLQNILRKNLTESVANIWDCTGGFHTLNCPFCKFELWFCKLNLWFCNLEVIPQLGDDLQLVSQLGGDFATWFAVAKMEFQLAKWHTCAWRWFRSCKTPYKISQVGFISQLISQVRNGLWAMKFSLNFVRLSSNGHNFFFSTPIHVPFEALESWLPKILNDI